MTKEAWLANYNEVGDYFGALKKAIDEVRAENAAKETIYIPLEVELPSPYGTFTPENVNNLPSMLAKEHESDFNVLKELLKAVWKNYVERIKAHEPDHDAYYEYRHGAEATKLWKENEAEIYAFLTTFETLLDAEKERRFGDSPAISDMRIDDGFQRAVTLPNGEKKVFRAERIETNITKDDSELLKGFEEKRNVKKAAKFIKKKFDIDASYSKLKKHPEVADDMNQELIRAYNVFGTVGIIEKIEVDDDYVKDNKFASYRRESRTILLRSDRGRVGTGAAIKNVSEGRFSTRSELHPYRHEIGHALWEYLKLSDSKFTNRMWDVYSEYFIKTKKGHELLSRYAKNEPSEMFAEAIAEILNGTPREVSKKILEKIMGKPNDQ